MTPMLRDFSLALRSLRRSRAFSTASIATIALGIGSATAIFSVVDTVLLRPLPFAEAHRVVVPLSATRGGAPCDCLSYADFMDWRDNRIFQNVAVFQSVEMDLASEGEAVRVPAAAVGPEFFAAVGAIPRQGRAFDERDYPVSAGRAVVISDRLWRTRFGGRADIIGLEVDVNAIRRPIVGVLPPGAEWPLDRDLWVPLRFSTELDPGLQRRDNFIFSAVARLAPGRTLEGTNAEMGRLAARVTAEHPDIRANVTMTAVPILDFALGATTPRALWMLLGAVGLLLLIGCVNVANLQLARATARQRDMAVRIALGASRYHLARQTFAESLLLAAFGGVLGALFARWMVAGIVAIAPADVPRIAETSVSLAALAFALAVSLIVAILFGTVAAVQAMRSASSGVIGDSGTRTTVGHHGSRTRRALVALEIALSVVLLAGAGLAIRSIAALQRVDPGFDPQPVITASISLPGIHYNTRARVTTFFDQLREGLANAPGIAAAGITSASPMGAGGFYLGRAMIAEGRGPGPEGEIGIQWSVATPGYFAALSAPLLRGRDFTAHDDSASTPVMIVNETFARRMFPGEDAIGKRAMSSRDEKVYREIVGIVGDVKYGGVRDTAQNLVWVPYAQNAWGLGMVTVRARGPAATAVQSMRRVLQALDPTIALANVATMEETMSRALARDRLIAILLGVFAALALTLAAIGIFGVLSYIVEQRTRELGIRAALGAQRRDLTGLVVREMSPMVLGGIAGGLIAGLALSRMVAALFYGIRTADPLTLGGVSLLLAIVALAAALVPARRAARADPLHVLRGE